MYDDDGVSHPGSILPGHALDYVKVTPPGRVGASLDRYLSRQSWKAGTGVVLVGEPDSRKSTYGLWLARKIVKADPSQRFVYLSEDDYLQDQRELWFRKELAQRLASNDVVWSDLMAWEREFNANREADLLFLDNFGEGYSPSHIYEVANLIRRREDLKVTTIIGVRRANYENLSSGTKAILSRRCITINTNLEGPTDGGE